MWHLLLLSAFSRPHPYSFASRSHCVPLPDPGPPRTKTTGSFALAAPGSAPSSTAEAPPAVASEATAEAAIDGVECEPLRRPPQPANRVGAPPADAVDDDDDRSSAAATSALVVVCVGLPGAPAERPENTEMPAEAGARAWSPLPLGVAAVGPRKPPRVAVAVCTATAAAGCCCRNEALSAVARQQSCMRAKPDLAQHTDKNEKMLG